MIIELLKVPHRDASRDFEGTAAVWTIRSKSLMTSEPFAVVQFYGLFPVVAASTTRDDEKLP